MSALLVIKLIEITDLVHEEGKEVKKPYCRFSLTRPHLVDKYKYEDSKTSDVESKEVKGDDHPVWNKKFELPSLFRDDILAIDVFDSVGHLHHSRHLGTAFVPLLKQPRGEKLNLWLPIEEDKAKSGEVHIRLTLKGYEKDPLATEKRVAKEATHAAAGYVGKKAALRIATVALAGTAAAPALPFLAAGATAAGVYNAATKVKAKYNQFYASDPSALLPLKCEIDPVVPKGASTRPIGKLKFFFGSASGLKAMDTNAKGHKTSSDPYARIYLNDYEGKHYRAWETGLQADTLNPEWHIPPWSALYLTGSSLTIAFWDKDLGKKDDFLGVATIQIDKLIAKSSAKEGEEAKAILPLRNKDGEEKGKWGEVRFGFRYTTVSPPSK